MNLNIIRAIIFFIPGLLLIFYPKKVNSFQNYILEKLHFKYRIKKIDKSYLYSGIIFVITAIVLLMFSF